MARTLLPAIVALLFAATTASAQTYPAKPVHVIAPFPPGGGVDLVTRIVTERLAARLGQRFVVENRTGAGGMIGAEVVARAAPDGYMLMVQPDTLAIVPSVLPKVPVDVLKDFAPVVMMASVPMIVAVHPAVPVRSAAELVALAKQKPGGITYASAGNGSPQHLLGELFKLATGTDLLHVPYRGAAPAVADTVAGHVQITFMGLAGIAAHVKSGALIPIAAATPKRSPFLPNVATLEEQGVRGVASVSWFGLFAPARTPEAIVQKLNTETNAVLAAAETRAKLADLGVEPLGGTAAEFAATLRRDFDRYAKVVKDAKIKPD